MKLVDKDVYQEFRSMLGSQKTETLRILRLLREADSRVTSKKASEANTKLTDALREIRKELDIYARKSFSCCGSCGSYELANKCDETGKRGYMFYSRQAKDSLYECGQVYFNFSYHDPLISDDDENDKTEKLGKQICSILKKHKLNVEWDGNYHTAIKVMI